MQKQVGEQVGVFVNSRYILLTGYMSTEFILGSTAKLICEVRTALSRLCNRVLHDVASYASESIESADIMSRATVCC